MMSISNIQKDGSYLVAGISKSLFDDNNQIDPNMNLMTNIVNSSQERQSNERDVPKSGEINGLTTKRHKRGTSRKGNGSLMNHYPPRRTTTTQ